MSGKPRVFVLGATGMLGHRLSNGLIDLGYDVVAGVRNPPGSNSLFASMPVFRNTERVIAGLDAFDPRTIRAAIAARKPDVVINCIGVIKQRSEGKASIPCIAINALLPHILEEAVSAYGGVLIHFSTDCVFKGNRGRYTEADPPDADDWYGRTKAMGEVVGPCALTLRTSIIGPELSGFTSLVEWYLSNAGKKIKGFDRAIYSGLTTREMVHVLDALLSHHLSLRGLYQVASSPISKYQLLVLLTNELGLSTEIDRDTNFELDRSMSAVRFAEATGYCAPSWDEMIFGLCVDIQEYWNKGWGIPPPMTAFTRPR